MELMLGEVKMDCLTLVRAGPHLLVFCTQLLAVGSFMASLDDSSQKEVVAWPGPGCNMKLELPTGTELGKSRRFTSVE